MDDAVYIKSQDDIIAKLMRWWGMCFRGVFIVAVAYFGYFYLHPRSIGDITFAHWTFDDVFNSVLAIGLVLGCGVWLICFPYRDSEYRSDPYVKWAKVSLYLVVAVAMSLALHLLD